MKKLCLVFALFFSCTEKPYFPDMEEGEAARSSSSFTENSSSSNDGYYPPLSSSSSAVSSSSSALTLAECGDGGYYNPATHFCVGNTFYKKCGGNIYDIDSETCDTRDDQIYQFIKIGTQTWMLDNLNYSANQTTGYCYGADIFAAEHTDLETCDNGDGRFYRWPEVSPDTLCPSGWHIPSVAEWQTVISASKPSAFYRRTGNYNGNPKWTVGWGNRGTDANMGFYWTITDVNYSAIMSTSVAMHDDASITDMFSVRCIKN